MCLESQIFSYIFYKILSIGLEECSFCSIGDLGASLTFIASIVSYKQTERPVKYPILLRFTHNFLQGERIWKNVKHSVVVCFASKNAIIFIEVNNIRDSLVARITVCRMVDRGSIPRRGAFFSSPAVFFWGRIDGSLSFYPIIY